MKCSARRLGLGKVIAAIILSSTFGLESGCQADVELEIDSGVSLALADHRAATISDLSYEIWLTIPERRFEPISGKICATFRLEGTETVIFDFAQPKERIKAVRVSGEPVVFEVRDEHVFIPVADHSGELTSVDFEFFAGDEALNRQEEFLYSLFVPDRARFALPIFDQPNLKARFRLHLDIPDEWVAIANSSVEFQEVRDGRKLLHFADTQPLSTYLFAFAVGKFQVETAELRGRPVQMFHRETDRRRVVRNLDTILGLHESALDWLEDYTGIPYPFEKFGFALIPSFQFGGMEHPGAIFYRANRLLLDEEATQSEALGRASLIAHETAHQWFGDFVTMDWFNDVWMKETFANFMAAKIVNPEFPSVDHQSNFFLSHYPSAYDVDRTAGANPIRQPLDNLANAGALYGPIIYQKAPVAIKHLERLIGDSVLRDGLREYLLANAYSNADWPDLVEILDRRTNQDLSAWSQSWVYEKGRPEIETIIETDGGKIANLTLIQSDSMGNGRLWHQQLDVRLGYADGTSYVFPVRLNSRMVTISEAAGLPIPAYALANGEAHGYGLMTLDADTREYLLGNLPELASSRERAIAWVSLWDALLEGKVEPWRFIDLAQRALLAESDELNIDLVLRFLSSTYWRYLSPQSRLAVAPRVEAVLWNGIGGASQPSIATAYFDAYKNIAMSSRAIARLERIWRGDESVPQVTLSERDLSELSQGLAVRGVRGSEAILQEQLARIENVDRRKEFEFVMPSLSTHQNTRDRFFESLADPANRVREPWVLAGLSFLNHPLRARRGEHYIRPSLERLKEIQQTGDIFFPERWVHAVLDGHQTASAFLLVQKFLQDRNNLDEVMREKVLQAADGLGRASQAVDVQSLN